MVLHYVGAQIGSGPGAQERREQHQQRGETEAAAREQVGVRGICANSDIDEILHDVDVIERVEPEAHAEDQAEDPEAVAKLEVGGFHEAPDANWMSDVILYARCGICYRSSRTVLWS